MKQEPGGGLRLTAMMDVCFLLLIFFVATATFTLHEGILPADLPAGPGAAMQTPDVPPRPLEIRLIAAGPDDVVVTVGGQAGRALDEPNLRDMLAEMQYHSANPAGLYAIDCPVLVRPDAAVGWDAVVAAVNAARAAGYHAVQVSPPGA